MPNSAVTESPSHGEPLPNPRGGYRFTNLDPAKTALLVIDMQSYFLDPTAPVYVDGALDIIPAIDKLARALRAAGGTVIYTCHTVLTQGPCAPQPWQTEREGFATIAANLQPSVAGHGVHPSLSVEPSDLVIDKYRYSALLPMSSTLHLDLQTRGIDTIIVSGTVTNVCCESTARDASMMGYQVVFVADATAARSAEAQAATLENMQSFFADVRNTADIVAMLDRRG